MGTDHKHSMTSFKDLWAGRTFICKVSGEILTIPEDVKPSQFFSFGGCFVDVGDGFHARFGGSVEEVKKDG